METRTDLSFIVEPRNDPSFIKAQGKALVNHVKRNAALTAQNAALVARVQELADEVNTLTEQRDALLDTLEATVQYVTAILEAI